MTDQTIAELLPFVAYARQSQTKEGSESKADQFKRMADTARLYGVRLVAFLEEPDSTSGYASRGLNRKQWKVLLDMIRSGEAVGVMVYETARLSRGGGPGYAPFVAACEAVQLDLNKVVLTPGGFVSEFELGIRATMDREQSAKMSVQQREMAAKRAAAGRPHFGGHRPYGFLADRVTHNATEVKVLVEVAERILAGESVYAIARGLNDRGVPTVTGKAWITATLISTLTSPRMAGKRIHKGKVLASSWEPILDFDTYEAVCGVLTPDWKRSHRRAGRKANSLLGEMVFCGRCGTRLYSSKTSPTIPVYRCVGAGTAQGCGHMSRHADKLDAFVRDAILAQATLDGNEAPTRANPKLARAEGRLKNFTAMYADGDLTDAEYRSNVAQVKKQIADFKAQADLGTSLPTGMTEVGRRAWWEAKSTTLEMRRALLATVIDRVVVNPTPKGRRYVDLTTVDIYGIDGRKWVDADLAGEEPPNEEDLRPAA